MKPSVTRTLLSLTTVALLLLAGESRAETIYTNTSIQPETTTEWSHDFILPKFDPSLGSLEAVHITATYELTMSGSVFNTSAGTQDFWFQAGSQLPVTLPGGLGVLEPLPLAREVHYVLPGGGSASYGPFTKSDTVDIILTGTDMNPFIGTGNIDLPASTLTLELISGGGGNIGASLTTTAGATVTVEFFDSPVPEPSANALLFVALGMMPFLLRRRH